MKTDLQLEEEFHLHAYRKQDLAMLYFPDLSKTSAVRNLRRWIVQCPGLCRALEEVGYDIYRKFYSRKEVELIVEYLGRP